MGPRIDKPPVLQPTRPDNKTLKNHLHLGPWDTPLPNFRDGHTELIRQPLLPGEFSEYARFRLPREKGYGEGWNLLVTNPQNALALWLTSKTIHERGVEDILPEIVPIVAFSTLNQEDRDLAQNLLQTLIHRRRPDGSFEHFTESWLNNQSLISRALQHGGGNKDSLGMYPKHIVFLLERRIPQNPKMKSSMVGPIWPKQLPPDFGYRVKIYGIYRWLLLFNSFLEALINPDVDDSKNLKIRDNILPFLVFDPTRIYFIRNPFTKDPRKQKIRVIIDPVLVVALVSSGTEIPRAEQLWEDFLLSRGLGKALAYATEVTSKRETELPRYKELKALNAKINGTERPKLTVEELQTHATKMIGILEPTISEDERFYHPSARTKDINPSTSSSPTRTYEPSPNPGQTTIVLDGTLYPVIDYRAELEQLLRQIHTLQPSISCKLTPPQNTGIGRLEVTLESDSISAMELYENTGKPIPISIQIVPNPDTGDGLIRPAEINLSLTINRKLVEIQKGQGVTEIAYTTTLTLNDPNYWVMLKQLNQMILGIQPLNELEHENGWWLALRLFNSYGWIGPQRWTEKENQQVPVNPATASIRATLILAKTTSNGSVLRRFPSGQRGATDIPLDLVLFDPLIYNPFVQINGHEAIIPVNTDIENLRKVKKLYVNTSELPDRVARAIRTGCPVIIDPTRCLPKEIQTPLLESRIFPTAQPFPIPMAV